MGIGWHREPPSPIRYQANVHYVKLDVLKHISKLVASKNRSAYLDYVGSTNPPFHESFTLRGSKEFTNLCLDEIKGKPFLAVVHDNNVLVKICDGDQTPCTTLKLVAHPHYSANVSKFSSLKFDRFLTFTLRSTISRPSVRYHSSAKFSSFVKYRFVIALQTTAPYSRWSWWTFLSTLPKSLS